MNRKRQKPKKQQKSKDILPRIESSQCGLSISIKTYKGRRGIYAGQL